MDEMGHGWTDIAFMSEEQYQERMEQRSPRTKTEEEGP